MQRHRTAALVVALALALVASPAHAVDPGTADVGVTMRWVGVGTPRARAGETAVYDIAVTNYGPDTATGVVLNSGVTDQFDTVSLVCSDPTGCSESGTMLAPAASFTARLTVVVCCFFTGEDRDARVWTDVWTSADPNASNDTYTVNTKIVGPHRK
ncbi:MAG: DUF11 domain-containing protein [Actinobacteria bacterium]|nr:DUF11 domain-containing protein [Actinomycetota bacterium]